MSKIATDREWITSQEFASMFGISLRQVYRMATSEGMPKPLRIGSVLRWNRGEIDAWIKAQRAQATQPQ